MGVNLASFPNSRINPTPATSAAVQSHLTAPANTTAGLLPVFIAANSNRTYLTIRNKDAVNGIKFVNRPTGSAAPTVAQVLNTGFDIGPGEAYEVDTPEVVYACSITAAPATPIELDQGSG